MKLYHCTYYNLFITTSRILRNWHPITTQSMNRVTKQRISPRLALLRNQQQRSYQHTTSLSTLDLSRFAYRGDDDEKDEISSKKTNVKVESTSTPRNSNKVMKEQVNGSANDKKVSRKSKDVSLTSLVTLEEDEEKLVSHKRKTPSQTKDSEGGGEEMSSPLPPKKKVRSPRRSSPKIEPGSLCPPKGWLSIYTLVEELRVDKTAPVDTAGAEALPERIHGEKIFRFQVLIALMLSSQTKDAQVGETMRKLQKHGLNPENIRNTSDADLNALIYSVGFRNNKTKYIKATVEILIAQYDGDIPPNTEELMKLPGVGPKMAYLIENLALNKVTGISVDTHMHRIFNQLKWVKAKDPEKTREQLEGWLPRDRWGEVNYVWVGFGQQVQQQSGKMLVKALKCSRPKEAIKLLRRLGVNCEKEAEKMNVVEDYKAVASRTTNQMVANDIIAGG